MPAAPPFTVAIVEDHPEYRDALVGVLSASPELRLLEVCTDLPAGLRLLGNECPDVLLVDLGLPSGSGLTLIRHASRQWGARCSAAVLTVTGNEEHLLGAVAAGAKGYLFKSDFPADWLQATLCLACGQSPLHSALASRILKTELFNNAFCSTKAHLPKTLLQYVAAGYSNAEAASRLSLTGAEAGLILRGIYDELFVPGPELSTRELQLLTLLDKGLLFKRCAELMGVSESTTRTLANRAYQKLGANNLQTALYEARASRLIA